MKEFIRKNLQYPTEAKAAGISGTVHLRYGIDHRGEVTDVKIIKGLGYGCDEEAERVVRLLKFEIEHTRGAKVLFHKKIQLHFHPPKEKPATRRIQVEYQPKAKVSSEERTISYTITWNKA